MVKDFSQLSSRRPVISNTPRIICGPGISIFWALQKHLVVKRFATAAEVKQAVTFWLQNLDTDIFYARMEAFDIMVV
jgi:hypothetical protein